MQTHVSESSFQARAILGAWHSGDRQRLNLELNGLCILTHTAPDSGEQERLELLAEIADELRSASAGSSAEVVCSLLEHLAFPVKAVIPPSVWEPVAAGALLQ